MKRKRALASFIFALFIILVGPFCSVSSEALQVSRAHQFTYDLGVSTGNYGTGSYTEANLGLNYFAQDWLAWRNSLFGRFQTDDPTAYGLDTSLRAVGDFGTPKINVTAFVGPGFRIASGTPSAPFAEEGLVFHAGGLAIGAGARQIFDSWVHQGYGNDNQFFLDSRWWGNTLKTETETETQIELVRTVTFSAAHRYASSKLSTDENKRVYGSLYRDEGEGFGHNFLLEAYFTGPVDPLTGMIANLADVDRWLREVASHFDHRFLNELPDFAGEAPTLERVVLAFYARLRPLVSAGVHLKQLRLYEGDQTWVDYFG